MKNKLLLTISIMLVCILAITLFACKKNGDDFDLNYYDLKDFTSLKNFTVVNSREPNTTAKYVNDGSRILFETTTAVSEGDDNVVLYHFSTDENKAYIADAWQDVDVKDVDDYLSSIADRTGLAYVGVQETYVTEIATHKYAIDPDHFFREAFRIKYETIFGKDYEESEFTTEYESQKESLFGNVDNYMITLDCTTKKQMTLSIENQQDKKLLTYKYSDIENTDITMPKE
ncbi:MAG: hypothetical protein K2I46_01360 [Clostridia bacterium]|nr:hypothetical protein [Clostridia bacterium]MDE6471478.1 hypothetical protein [Clostridia bacterium]